FSLYTAYYIIFIAGFTAPRQRRDFTSHEDGALISDICLRFKPSLRLISRLINPTFPQSCRGRCCEIFSFLSSCSSTVQAHPRSNVLMGFEASVGRLRDLH
ncbi:Poly(U)-specific endoribonuclease, partial [Clarias magur]